MHPIAGFSWKPPPDVQCTGPAVLLLEETLGHAPHWQPRLSPVRHQHCCRRSHHRETWQLLRKIKIVVQNDYFLCSNLSSIIDCLFFSLIKCCLRL